MQKLYNKNRRKNNNINTFIQTQKPKSDNNNDNEKKIRKVVYSLNNTINNKKKRKVVESVNKNNRTLIIGLSNCVETYLMYCILHQQQEPFFIFTKSLNQYPNIKAQSSDEIEPLENYENSAVVFDDLLLSKQGSNIDLFFTRSRHQNIEINYISQSYYHLPKNTFRNNSNIIFLFKQTLRDIILLFHDIAGLDMNLDQWKQLCRKDWETEYDYLREDRFAKVGKDRYTIRN